MPRTVTYTCIVCNEPRQVSNRWFVSCRLKDGGFHIATWEHAVRDGILNDETTDYLCGQACCHKLLDMFLQKTLDDERQEDGHDD